jgi:hypothetical protein
MRNWAEKYVHRLSEKTLAGNCLGLAREILREEFGKEYPGYLGALKTVLRGGKLPMEETKVLSDGTLVVCGNYLYPCRHVGVYCAAIDRVVHALPEEGIVRAYTIWRLKQEWPSVTLHKVN